MISYIRYHLPKEAIRKSGFLYKMSNVKEIHFYCQTLNPVPFRHFVSAVTRKVICACAAIVHRIHVWDLLPFFIASVVSSRSGISRYRPCILYTIYMSWRMRVTDQWLHLEEVFRRRKHMFIWPVSEYLQHGQQQERNGPLCEYLN